MKFFENFGKKIEQTPLRILPSDVRYALEYKEGKLNSEDIEVLVMSNFEDEAFYLALKGLVNNKDEHKILLEKYISQILPISHGTPDYKKEIQNIVNEELSKNKDFEVDGVKLAQISRQGFDTWHKKFDNLAVELSLDKKDVFLVAHSTILGLDSFLKSFAKENKDLNIVIPSWIKNEHIGYNITFSEGKGILNSLEKNFKKDNSILVDDTKNTGNTLNHIQALWQDSAHNPPEIKTVVG